MSGKHPKRKERLGVDRSGRSPLHYAVVDADAKLVIKLLASGLDPGAADDDGWTPLHFAVQNGSSEILQLLLEAGAAVDPCDKHGNTPLSNAVFNYDEEDGTIIKLLRANGANPRIKNAYGVSPLELARSCDGDVKNCFNDVP